MSYDQTTQGSRRNYDDDSNYPPSGGTKGIDDSTLSGSRGGSGVGQGGYTESQSRWEGRKTFDSGDNYCETDPGMAGNRGFQDTQDINVPGAGRMGGEQDTGSYGQTLGGQGRSRGYERDNDEYDESGVDQGQGAGAGRPSMGSKIMGGMEKMAGKVSGKPNIEARGEQRQSGF